MFVFSTGEARSFAIVGALIVLAFGAAQGGGRATYVPMTFYPEVHAISTSGCLQVIERVYPNSAWWEQSAGDASTPENAFTAVIQAIDSKDRRKLFELSVSRQREDSERFEEQSTALFEQFEEVELSAVPRAYEVGELVIFDAKFQHKENAFTAPFVFAYESDGALRFLPFRTDELTYRLVKDWFSPMRELVSSDDTSYCSAVVNSATHRLPLTSPKQARSPMFLLLDGAPLDDPGEHSDLAKQVESTISRMRLSLAEGRISDYLKHFTPEGAGRLKEWLSSADESERAKYESAVKDQQPFFLFDLSSLVVVYTRTPSGLVQVMYFTSDADGQLLWTNASHVTVSDQIFKKGPLHDAATTDKPFSGFAIR